MKVLEYLKEHLLIFAIIMLALFVIAVFSLEVFGLRFLNSVYYFVIPVILVFVVVGTIQMIVKFKNKVIKVIATILFAGVVIVCILTRQIIGFLALILYTPENFVEIDGVKYVAYVDTFFTTNVRYYEYVNELIRKDTISFNEYYGGGWKNPFEEDSDASVIRTTYYDENGEKVKVVNADGTIVEENNSSEQNDLNISSEDISNTQNILVDEEMQIELEKIWGNNIDINSSLENKDVSEIVETFIKQNDMNEVQRILEENDIENLIKDIN